MMYKITESFEKHNDVRETIKLSSFGLKHLSEEELLSAFFQTGKKDMKPLAASILSDIPLAQFHRLDLGFLLDHGVPEKKAISLLAVIELVKRSFMTVESRSQVVGTMMLAKRLQAQYGHEEQEHVVAIYLDAKNKIIEEKVISIGSATRSVASTKDILKHALRLNAVNLIVAHNHPSGVCRPSSSDNEFTESLKKACEWMEILLIDHLIVSKDSYYSYLEKEKL